MTIPLTDFLETIESSTPPAATLTEKSFSNGGTEKARDYMAAGNWFATISLLIVSSSLNYPNPTDVKLGVTYDNGMVGAMPVLTYPRKRRKGLKWWTRTNSPAAR